MVMVCWFGLGFDDLVFWSALDEHDGFVGCLVFDVVVVVGYVDVVVDATAGWLVMVELVDFDVVLLVVERLVVVGVIGVDVDWVVDCWMGKFVLWFL